MKKSELKALIKKVVSETHIHQAMVNMGNADDKRKKEQEYQSRLAKYYQAAKGYWPEKEEYKRDVMSLGKSLKKSDSEIHDDLQRYTKPEDEPSMNNFIFESKISSLIHEVIEETNMENPCWKGYKAYGTKEKDGKNVPNCVPVKEQSDETDSLAQKFFLGAYNHIKKNGQKKTHYKQLAGLTQGDWAGESWTLGNAKASDLNQHFSRAVNSPSVSVYMDRKGKMNWAKGSLDDLKELLVSISEQKIGEATAHNFPPKNKKVVNTLNKLDVLLRRTYPHLQTEIEYISGPSAYETLTVDTGETGFSIRHVGFEKTGEPLFSVDAVWSDDEKGKKFITAKELMKGIENIPGVKDY